MDESVAGSSSSVGAVNVDNQQPQQDESQWIMSLNVMSVKAGDGFKEGQAMIGDLVNYLYGQNGVDPLMMISIDSGSDAHACPRHMGAWGVSAGGMGSSIVGIHGGKIQVYGFHKIKCYVQLVDGATRLVQSTFMVGDVRKMILSAGQLLEAGINVFASKDKDKPVLGVLRQEARIDGGAWQELLRPRQGHGFHRGAPGVRSAS